jgi:hypothetical protein
VGVREENLPVAPAIADTDYLRAVVDDGGPTSSLVTVQVLKDQLGSMTHPQVMTRAYFARFF